MTFFFQTSLGRSMESLQVIKERYFITILAVLRKNFFCENWQFFEIFCIPGSQIFWKMTNFFVERYRPEIYRGLHKWCCERMLRRFSSFEAKNFFLKIGNFFDFFCISGVTDSLKNDRSFLFPKENKQVTSVLYFYSGEVTRQQENTMHSFKLLSQLYKYYISCKLPYLYIYLNLMYDCRSPLITIITKAKNGGLKY